MNVNEEELIGESSDDVPTVDPTDENCMGKKTSGGVFQGYCQATPGRGTDHVGRGRCKHHGGAANNRGENNGNYKHGGYSKFQDFLTDGLNEREQEAIQALDFDENAQQFAKDVVKEAYAKYLRSGDDRFLREARQWASEFGVIEAAPEKFEGNIDVDATRELSEQEREHLDQLTGKDS